MASEWSGGDRVTIHLVIGEDELLQPMPRVGREPKIARILLIGEEIRENSLK